MISTSTSQQNSWKKRYGMIYVYALFLLGNIVIVLGPLIPIKAKDGGHSETDYSFVFTLRGLGYVIGSFASPKLEKKYGSHEVMTLSSILAALLCFLNISENGIFLNAVEWFLLGCCCSLIEVLAQVNIWMQALHFGFGLGAFVSPLISTFIGSQSLTVLALMAIINAILMYRQVSPKVQNQQTKLDTKKQTKPELPKNLAKVISLFFFLDVGFQLSYGGWIPTFCTLTGITDEKQAGLSASIFWLTMTVGRLLAIPLANKFKVQSQLRVLVSANVIITGFCLLMMITGNLIIIAYLGSALVGFAVSAIYPLLMSIPGAFGYELSASNTAMFTVCGSSGEAILPIFVGYLIHLFGPKFLFIKFFVVSLGMFALYYQIMTFQPKIQQQSKIKLETQLLDKQTDL